MTSDNDPVKIEDRHLLAYLDGEADAQMTALIESSEEHLGRAAALAQMQNRLKAKLHRVDCPETLQLGEYKLGLLNRKRVNIIEEHVADCPHCQRELDQLQAYLQEDTPQARLDHLKGVKVLIARLLGEGLERSAPGGFLLRPAYATLRGGNQGLLTLEADGVLIILDIQPSIEKQVKILGQVVAQDQRRWTGATVDLRQDSTMILTSVLDDLGAFRIERIESGMIELTIIASDGLVILANLEIRDE